MVDKLQCLQDKTRSGPRNGDMQYSGGVSMGVDNLVTRYVCSTTGGTRRWCQQMFWTTWTILFFPFPVFLQQGRNGSATPDWDDFKSAKTGLYTKAAWGKLMSWARIWAFFVSKGFVNRWKPCNWILGPSICDTLVAGLQRIPKGFISSIDQMQRELFPTFWLLWTAGWLVRGGRISDGLAVKASKQAGGSYQKRACSCICQFTCGTPSSHAHSSTSSV